jgi:hypothetical protein
LGAGQNRIRETRRKYADATGWGKVRQVQEYLHPNGEHMLDCFHITMRITVLQQQTKTLQAEKPEAGAAASKQVESVKHLLWHGNVEEALERVGNLLMDLDLIRKHAIRKHAAAAEATLVIQSASPFGCFG